MVVCMLMVFTHLKCKTNDMNEYEYKANESNMMR